MDKKNYISRNDLIIFRDTFNKPINEYLKIINTHKTIYFGKAFDLDISLIPKNITTIIFVPDSLFNKKITDLHFEVKKIVILAYVSVHAFYFSIFFIIRLINIYTCLILINVYFYVLN